MAVNPHLKIYRAHFSGLIPAYFIFFDFVSLLFTSHIQRACETLAPPNKRLSDAVDARSEVDLRIGTNGTCITLSFFKLTASSHQT